MSVVVVTVTETIRPPPTSVQNQHHSSTPAGVIVGVVIGILVGGILLVAIVFYLLRRYARHRFTRVANPHDNAPGADLRYMPSTNPQKSKLFARHLRETSVSSEPLMSSASWPPKSTTSRVLSSDTRPNPIFPGTGVSPQSSFDAREINQVVLSGTGSYSSIPSQHTLPETLRPDSGSPPLPHTQRTPGVTSTPSPPRSSPTLFLNRMLKSRAQASEDVSLSRHPSPGFLPSRSTTLDSTNRRAEEDQLIAEAERTALRDAERAKREKEEMVKEEESWDEAESAESIYSQGSAPIEHSFSSHPISHANNSLSVPRRGSSRKSRATELAPVVEAPDTTRFLEGQNIFRPVSTGASSSLDAHLSHRTASPSAVDQPLHLPLLTFPNFGSNSTPPGTLVGSMSSNVGRGSSSCASRYPSLAPSSIVQLSRPVPRSDVDTDWHHPPPGLAGLASLRIGPLENPHSPVDERPKVSDGAPVQLARLRNSAANSVPEVERRDVMQGGIASIDVVL